MTTELTRSEWAGPRQTADRVEIDESGVTLTMGLRRRCIAREQVGEVHVWRGEDGLRHNMLISVDGRELVVLVDQRWRVPGDGRIGSLLRTHGWNVTTKTTPPGGGTRGEFVAGGGPRWWPLPVGLPVGAGMLVLLGVLTVGVLGSTAPQWRDEVAVAVSALALLFVLLLGLSWVPGRIRIGIEPAVRPLAGSSRHGWRHDAGLGLREGRVVAADGWGRYTMLPVTGDGAAASVGYDETATALIARDGQTLFRLPHPTWSAPGEAPGDTAARVAGSLRMPSGGRVVPGGQELEDPERPSAAGLVVGGIGAITPPALALAASLAVAVGAWVWSAIATGAIVLAIAALVIRRIRLGAGQTRTPAQERTGEWSWTLAYPLWAGALVIVFILTVGLVGSDAAGGWIGVLAVVGLIGLALTLRSAYTSLWRLAALAPAVMSGLFALAMREILTVWIWWPVVAAGIAAVALAARELRRFAKHER